MDDRAAQRGIICFQRRRRAAQNQRPFQQPHPFARYVDSVVPWNGVLLVTALVRLVDDQQAQVLERREDRAARADDDVDLPALRGVPRVESLALRKPRVQHGDALAERALETARGLGGQRNLRNEDDRSPAFRNRSRDRPDVYERLAATGDALQEKFREATALDGGANCLDRNGLFGRGRKILGFDGTACASRDRAARPLPQCAGATCARYDRLRKAREQRIAAAQRPFVAHAGDERFDARSAYRRARRLENFFRRLGDARADELWTPRERAAAHERSQRAQQRPPISRAARLRVAQQHVKPETLAEILGDQPQQPRRHRRKAFRVQLPDRNEPIDDARDAGGVHDRSERLGEGAAVVLGDPLGEHKPSFVERSCRVDASGNRSKSIARDVARPADDETVEFFRSERDAHDVADLNLDTLRNEIRQRMLDARDALLHQYLDGARNLSGYGPVRRCQRHWAAG